jgi:hypothetical protein
MNADVADNVTGSKDNNMRNRSENDACGYWAVGTPSTSNVSLEKRHIFLSLPPSLFRESSQYVSG